jgi:hypothetical protein
VKGRSRWCFGGGSDALGHGQEGATGTTCKEGSARWLLYRSREEQGEEGRGRLGVRLRRRKKGGPPWAGAMWRGGVGVRRRHDAGAEEEGGGWRGATAWFVDRGGAWAAPGGRGPVALGRPESTVSFPI